MKTLKSNLSLAAFAALVLTASSARADVVLYATSKEGNKLVTVNVTAGQTSDFHLVPAGCSPDSLILAPSGVFVYDCSFTNQIRAFNPVANTDTLLADATVGINEPQDMLLDPGGATVLVSNFSGNTITRTNLTTGATVVLKNIARPEGLAYDKAGRLFVLAGGFNGVANLYQIDPVTGATIAVSAAFDPNNQLDGLVFDPFSGLLFAGSQSGNSLYSIDPSTLVATKVGTVPVPDGLITDTHGLLYIASRDFHVYSFNVLTNTVTQLQPVVFGLDDLGVIALSPPTITKTFGAPTVITGNTTTLTFNIVNSNQDPVTGINFADTLPAGITASGPVVGNCGVGSTITVTATSVALTNATLAGGGTCTFSVTITGVTAGLQTNCVTVNTANAGIGNQSCANITVVGIVPPPSIVKTFNPASIGVGQPVSLNFAVTNTAAVALTATGFTDTLPAGLVVSSPSVITGTCFGGTITAVAGAGAVSLASAAIPAGATCNFSVSVTPTTPGVITNNVTVLDTVVGVGNTSTTTLTVIAPPVIEKSFGVGQLNSNGSTSLSFKITNPNLALALTGVAFTDTLPAGLTISNPTGLVGTCGGGAITASAGTSTITLTGATLAAAASCTFSVNVTAIGSGLQNNVTSTVTSTNGGSGPPATASLTILQLLDSGEAFQVRYASNLDQGDSVFNLTNTGTLTDPAAFTTTGNICANVYTFDANEEMISCCSCPVTPNGLNSLSANTDLISNTLTAGRPTSIIVKLVATIPLPGNVCNPSSPTPLNLVPMGLKAWGTTLHALPTTPTSFGLIEGEFEASRLSVAELTKLTTFCGFIQANGSGFGICKTCRTGGLGAGGK